MARKLKSHAISGRVDDDEFEQIMAYTDNAEIGFADLVRDAVKEYMTNHPIKVKQEV